MRLTKERAVRQASMNQPRPLNLNMITPMYNDTVVDHFDHPRNRANDSDVSTGSSGGTPDSRVSGQGGSVDSGVWIEFCFKMDRRQIQVARFRAYGCPHTVALASWLTERLVGETLNDGYTLDKQEIVSLLDLPTQKMRSILVAEDAIRNCAVKLESKEDQ